MTFYCYVLLQFSPTFTVVLEAGGTHACVPPAHIGQENAQRILSNCNLYVTRLMQMTTNKTVDEKLVSMFYFLNVINLVSFQAWSRPMTSFQ